MPAILGDRGGDLRGSLNFLVLDKNTLGMLRSGVGLPKGHTVLSSLVQRPFS